MKRFIIKFCILFAIIDGFLLWYALAVYPNISGDMGALYKYPFGKQYNDSIKQAYQMERRYVEEVHSLDSMPENSIVTIGDSFSQQDSLGYQQYCGASTGSIVYNLRLEDFRNPEQNFVRLVNQGVFDSTQIVVVESVERTCLDHLNSLDFEDAAPTPVHVQRKADGPARTEYAEEAMQKLRLMLGYRKPIVKFTLSCLLFTHPKYQGEIFIYHSPFIGDSDLIFKNDSAEIVSAYANLEKLYRFATAHKVHLIYLIVPDKYDVYCPYIVDAPRYNMTLDMCPNVDYILNPRDSLRLALEQGEKDVWYLNDTHWSPVGAKIAGEMLAEKSMHIK